MSVIVVNSRSSKSSSYGNLFVTENDKIATKMTAMEDLEQREQEIKSKLELADSLEERKQLRTELREIRRKIFEGPVSSSPAVKVDVKPDPPKTTTRIVKEENAKNLELNSNKILTKTSSLKNSTPEPKSQTSTTRTTATTNKINMSVARRSRLFQTDDNNNNSKPEPTPTGPKLKIQAQGDDVPALRTRDPTDRAARRARRAQQQREMSIDQGIGTEKKEEAKTSIVVDTPKENVKPEEERKPSSTSIKVSSSNSSLSVKNEEKPKGSTEIRRSGTWGGSKDRAAGNIGKALNKFGAQKDASKPAGTTLKTTRPTSSYGGGRFSSLKSDPLPPPPPQPEPAQQSNGPPSFGSGGSQSAGDRMAFFRQAAEKEKEKAEKKKANEESRRKQMEMVNALMNGEMEMAKTKTEEKEPPKTEKKEPPKTEKKETQKTEKREMKDSDKMRNASAPCMKKREKKKVTRRTMSIGSIVLDWVQEMIKDYPVKVTNFSSSWNNGMAFCALIHHFNPDEFDFSTLKPENKRENFDLAFETGMKAKKIPILLDTEDMVVMERPEPRSVQTYIQWIWSVYGPTSGYGPTPQEVQK